MQAVGFGYKCQECGQGTVLQKVIPEYRTRIKGYPFVVKDAMIGVCDSCGAKHFAAEETERWENMFEAEHAKCYLEPKDIQELRNALGLQMEQFAVLIGCTRQSLYNWERADRRKPQSRMADLLMKLARDSREKGKVDVLSVLINEARCLGVGIELDENRSGTALSRTRHNEDDVREALRGAGTGQAGKA